MAIIMKSDWIATLFVVLAQLMLSTPHTYGQSKTDGQPQVRKSGPVRRLPDGKPNLQGFYQPDSGGANYGLEPHPEERFGLLLGRGIVIDPPDGKLPMQAWAKAEQESRARPERGYDDPTAHCFVYGVPRSTYTSPSHILQPAGYVVILYERMSYRAIPLDNRTHIPDSIRLWQGDPVGHWEGDTLVVESTNYNGKSWLNEIGEVLSHAQHVVERFTPVDADTINYQATVTDPLVYTRPWTIAFPLKRTNDEMLETACHEDNQDLQHLKDVKDAAKANGGISR